MGKGKNVVGTSDDKALSEVEHLLMRKTFSRVEFDRLTDILRARTSDADPPTSMVSHEEKNEESVRNDAIGGDASHQMTADDSPAVEVPSHGASSPVELAKQYMGSSYWQRSSSRSRLVFENKEASNIAYGRRSVQSIAQAPTDFGNENTGTLVNGYVTPVSRGRSAIYRMSRSPYFKGPSSSTDVSLSSLSQRAASVHAGGRQAVKRRGAYLENELGSIGPIRRIRRKSDLMPPFRDSRASPRGNLIDSHTGGYNFTEDNTSIQDPSSSKRQMLWSGQSLLPLDSHKNGDGKSSDNVPPVPVQSNKMAEKIFEQLNIIAPSPKEKQSGQQALTSNTSNSMSKKPVSQDNGPGGMCDLTTSGDGANGPLNSDFNGLLKKDKLNLIKDGSSILASSDKPSILGNAISASTSLKPGFKMAVIEDLPELDEDMDAPIPSNTSSKEVGTTEAKLISNREEQKVEQNILGRKAESYSTKNIVGSPVSEQPVPLVPKTFSSSGGFSSNTSEKAAIPDTSTGHSTGFEFSSAPPSYLSGNSVSASPLAKVNDNKQAGVSTSIFGPKQSTSDLGTSTAVNKSVLGQSVIKPTLLDSTGSERGDKRESAEDISKSSDKPLPSAASTLNAPLQFASGASTSSLSNGFSHSSSQTLATAPPTDKSAVSSAPSTTIFAVSSSSPTISSSSPAFSAFNFASSSSVGQSTVATAKSGCTTAEVKPASTFSFGIRGPTDEGKSTAPESASKSSANIFAPPISSSIATFSGSPMTSAATLSPVVASNDAPGAATTVPSNTSSTAPGVQSASTVPFTFSSSGKNTFGFSSPAPSTGYSTSSIAVSTSQPSAASALFGSKPPQSEGTGAQPSQSSVPQFGSSFPTVNPGAGASSSGSGALSFGLGASSSGSGTLSFGVGTSSSAPGTMALGLAASSSGPGIFSFGAGTSSSASGTPSFGAGAASSGTGALSFGAGAASSGTGTVSFGAGAASSGPGTVSFGAGAASSGSGAAFGAGAASSGPGTVSFGAGAASSGSGTVSFGATTSTSGPGFGNSPFGTGSTFSNPFSSSSGTGFTFSSASSSAGSSTVASTSLFASTSTASSASTFSNPFGSSSSPTSTFAFGQSASSGSGFAFGAQSAPAFSSQPPIFSFTSANASMSSSTPQPAFGMANTNTGFVMGSPGNDQMNEDSMADDTNQGVPAPAPAPIFGSSPFGQQNSSPAAPVFGAPAVQPGGVFQFGGQQQGSAPQNPSFPPAGSLEFQGGNFSLGSGGGGGDKSNRRVIKVKRAPKKR